MAYPRFLTYEDYFSEPYSAFHQQRRRRKGLPMPLTVTGTLRAYLNHSRWIAECPSNCGDAVFASRVLRRYTCSEPGCPDTGLYRVVFPPNFRQLEAELAKRPKHINGLPVHDNWQYPETVADIRDENRHRGIS